MSPPRVDFEVSQIVRDINILSVNITYVLDFK